MIIVLKPDATEKEIDHVMDRIKELGLTPHLSKGQERSIIGVIGDDRLIANQPFRAIPGVEDVVPILAPWKLAGREFKKDDTIVDVSGVKVGGRKLAIMAGPCAVEKKELTLGIAQEVKAAGASILRGGAYKPRTSPYAFQGLGNEGLDFLAEAKKQTGLPVVSEILDPRDIEFFLAKTDIIQIGARNMQNFNLLSEVGRAGKPVLIKRGASASIEELLMAAEYVVKEGNTQVILCERGIKTFERSTRYTLDISAIPVLKHETHLPVIVDPSHAAGKRDLVLPLARAAVAAGADGVIVEVHPRPEEALCDGPQLIPAAEFGEFAGEIRALVSLMGKTIG